MKHTSAGRRRASARRLVGKCTRHPAMRTQDATEGHPGNVQAFYARSSALQSSAAEHSPDTLCRDRQSREVDRNFLGKSLAYAPAPANVLGLSRSTYSVRSTEAVEQACDQSGERVNGDATSSCPLSCAKVKHRKSSLKDTLRPETAGLFRFFDVPYGPVSTTMLGRGCLPREPRHTRVAPQSVPLAARPLHWVSTRAQNFFCSPSPGRYANIHNCPRIQRKACTGR